MTVVGVFELCRGEVIAVFVDASVVEIVDSFQGRDLDVFEGLPGPRGLMSSVL